MTSSDEITDFLRSAMPLVATLGIRAREAGKQRVILELDWSERLCTAGGVLHGGAVMALADTAGATCAFHNLPDGASATSTIESKTNFLGAVTGGVVVAESTPLHVGSSTIVVETDVTCDGRRVAKVLQTQAVLRPRT